MPVITVFGTGRAKPGAFEYDTAEYAGKVLANNGFDIATGGYMGIMEAALKGAVGTNVKRIGVLTEFYEDKKPNSYITDVIESKTYLERLQKLIDIGDGYIVFPGGTGTMLELSMVLALMDRGLIKDKMLLIIGEQWNEIIQTMGYYSDRILESSSMVKYSENMNDGVNLLINYYLGK